MKLEVEDKELEKRLKAYFNACEVQYRCCNKVILRIYAGIIISFTCIIIHSFLAAYIMDYLQTFGCLVFSYFFKSSIKSLKEINNYLSDMMEFRNKILTDYIPENTLIIWDRKEIK